MNQPIVYVDENFIIAEKGIQHTVPLKTDPSEETLLSEVALEYPEVLSVKGKNEWEGGAMHRLDYETTGLVLFARNQSFYDYLTEVQQRGLFVKVYTAETTGVLKKNETVRSYFRAFGPRGSMVKAEFSKDRADSDREYETEIRETGKNKAGNSIVECRISRGFRHQIRVHLALLGCPILGDKLYSVSSDGMNENLHLRCVEFSFPLQNGSVFDYKVQ